VLLVVVGPVVTFFVSASNDWSFPLRPPLTSVVTCCNEHRDTLHLTWSRVLRDVCGTEGARNMATLSPHQIFYSSNEGDKMARGLWHIWELREMRLGCFGVKPKERDHL